VVSGCVLKVKQEGDTLRCVASSQNIGSSFVASYFRLDEDLEGILAGISKDETVTKAIERFYGLRLIRQDRWECLASFLLATNANIPRIQKMVAEVSARLADPSNLRGRLTTPSLAPETWPTSPLPS